MTAQEFSPRPAAAQFYPVRNELRRDLEGTVARIADLGFRGVQPSLPTSPELVSRELQEQIGEFMPPMFEAAELGPVLERHGLEAFAAHGPLPEGEHAQWVLDGARAIGARCIVVSAWMILGQGSDKAHEDLELLHRTIERFNGAAETAARHDLSIGFHNHYWEWQHDFGGRTAWEIFWDEVDPRVAAEVDVYWAHTAGQDPVDVVEKLGDRVRYLHLKDGPGTVEGAHTALGRGVVDLEGVIRSAPAAEWHIVELDRCDGDMIDAMRESRAWLLERRLSR